MNGARDYLVYSEMPASEVMTVTPEEAPASNQVTVGDYTTNHFDICPSAQELYKDINSKTDMVHLVVESMMLQDLLFKIEKQAIAMDNADEDMVEKAQHYADMIMELADEMELEEEHSYIEDVHMAKIKELANNDNNDDEDEESDDDMLPPSVRMMNAS
jgi:putative cell wall-binding protein